jgi:hypothetical protein
MKIVILIFLCLGFKISLSLCSLRRVKLASRSIQLRSDRSSRTGDTETLFVRFLGLKDSIQRATDRPTDLLDLKIICNFIRQ